LDYLTKSLGRDSNVIFPTKSPVDRLGGDKPSNPGPLSRDNFKAICENTKRKLKPLLKAKEVSDKVYSNGYFENHYPDADRELKSLLHEKVMAAWANAESDDSYEEEEFESHESTPTIQIIIS
jgi:hypothetical protein